MKMKNSLSVLFVTLMLLGGCATTSVPAHITAESIKNAKTKADHLALAEQYEAISKDMQAKADEHKKMLTSETKQPYLYGRSVEDMEERNKMLVEQYQKAAAFNLEMAGIHRDIASEIR